MRDRMYIAAEKGNEQTNKPKNPDGLPALHSPTFKGWMMLHEVFRNSQSSVKYSSDYPDHYTDNVRANVT